MSTLLLRLAAPLQSWGTDSKFETRRTGREPSKSGVIGLLAAALGIPRGGDLSALRHLRMGVRVDREGELLRDYHTAKGEKAYITERYYLCDAVFLLGLEGERVFLEEIQTALQNPGYAPYLGRRSCPPTLPLLLGLRESDLETALREEPSLTSDDGGGETRRRVLLDCEPGAEDAVFRQDLPLRFDRSGRCYGFRSLRCTMVRIGGDAASEHDPMAELEEEKDVSD